MNFQNILQRTKIQSEQKPINTKCTKMIYDAQTDNYFLKRDDGSKIKSNKRGDYIAKFVSDFSGFYDHHCRTKMGNLDHALMHHIPPHQNDRQRFHTPILQKFVGYAQFPYQISQQLPKYLSNSRQLIQKTSFQNSIYNTNQRTSVKSSKPKQIKNKQNAQGLFELTNTAHQNRIKRKVFTSDCNFRSNKSEIRLFGSTFQQNKKLKKQVQSKQSGPSDFMEQNKCKCTKQGSRCFNCQSPNSPLFYYESLANSNVQLVNMQSHDKVIHCEEIQKKMYSQINT